MEKLSLRQVLQLRQILTPKLIQTLKLLMLPKLDLIQKLNEELQENPLLEVVDPPIVDDKPNPKIDEQLDQWRKFLDGLSLAGAQLGFDEQDDTTDPLAIAKYEKSTYEDLMEQLMLAATDEKTKIIGEFIIGNLDERGFLPLTIEEIKNELKKQGYEFTDDDVRQALKVVQSLSPPGIAARDLRECLLIQLKDLGLEDSVAFKLVRDHFDELKTKPLSHLAKSLGVDEEEIAAAKEILSHLSFSPAGGRETKVVHIEPDLIVAKDDRGEWQIIYNDQGIPELTINSRYKELLNKSSELSDEAKEFLLKKLESARWWIDALRQRRNTLIATMRAILHFQREFFEAGPENLKPLTMEKVAEYVGVHPATISRIVRNKYVLTPYGTFPLRKFFVGGIKSHSGDMVATDTVKRRIKELIESENKHFPLSDERIAQILNSEGINIARRTVAKYRQQMGIPSARMRRI